MKKKLFGFIDNPSKIDCYKKLGFTVELDDTVNEIWNLELILDKYDNAAILFTLEEIEEIDGLNDVCLNYNETYYNGKAALEFMDNLTAQVPFEI
jgi:hypothetical protein